MAAIQEMSSADIAALPPAKPSQLLEIADGETIDLTPTIVRNTINGSSFPFYAYNGQFPGPILKVRQGSTFFVRVRNGIDQPTTVHWHGIRLENRFDGTAGMTQEAIQPGESFTYTVTVPDEGIFWYHPHVREDVQQDLGLYGLLHVIAQDTEGSPPVDREEYVILDDILLSGGSPAAYGKREANFALMGRFGNQLLVNGSPAPATISAQTNEVVRYYILNAANTRTFNVSFGESKARLVGADAGRYERTQILNHTLVLAPSERSIVDVLYWDAQRANMLSHINPTPIEGENSVGSRQQPLLFVDVAGVREDAASAEAFSDAYEHEDVIADIDTYRPFFDAPVDKTIHLSVTQEMMGHMQHGGMQMGGETVDGIEWEDPMPMMNAMATKANTQWALIDESSGAKNMDIAYNFTVGDKVKIRLINDTSNDGSDHPMQHPIHFHGQRFLVLAVNGKRNEDLAWKDTVLVPKDATVDILLDVTNPGDWMIHCHIAEHLSNGMMGSFRVSER